MNTPDYFRSLSNELQALKNRVRNFIDDDHWLTDGEWKESVLRATLNQHLPNHVEAARGFVLSENDSSGQIDVLLFDNRKPVLFRDGDLVFATPDAVLGIIEVKSRISRISRLRNFATSLADKARWLCQANVHARVSPDDIFVGLFAYEEGFTVDHEQCLQAIGDASQGEESGVVNHVAIGENYFAKFWTSDPNTPTLNGYLRWHSYDTPGIATGYFLHNVLHHVADESVSVNRHLYFPREGKEGWREATLPLTAM